MQVEQVLLRFEVFHHVLLLFWFQSGCVIYKKILNTHLDFDFGRKEKDQQMVGCKIRGKAFIFFVLIILRKRNGVYHAVFFFSQQECAMAVKTCLMVGGGGMAGGWINRMTQTFGDRIKIIGLVDVNQEVLDRQAQALGLSKGQLFTSYEDAVSAVKADFCGVATPPPFHAPATVAALEAGMPVISEKPIADTLDAAKDMVRAAQKTGLPCAIIQNYRYAPKQAGTRSHSQ